MKAEQRHCRAASLRVKRSEAAMWATILRAFNRHAAVLDREKTELLVRKGRRDIMQGKKAEK